MEIEEDVIISDPPSSVQNDDSMNIDPEVILQEVTDNLQHNTPIQAVDLLLEPDMIHYIVDMKEVDNTNVWKIGQYLLRIVHFHYEESERMKIYEAAYRLFSRFNMWIDRLVCAISMKNTQYILDTYNECDDTIARKQICEIVAKHRLSHLVTTNAVNEFSDVLTSSSLSDWFVAAAKGLDIAAPRLPETIITIPADNKVVSSYKQASRAIVNGLLNAGHCSECYFHDENGQWTKGFEENKGIGLMLASAAEGCTYMWSPYEGLNNLISLLNHNSSDVRQGALLGVGLTCNGIYNPQEDLPLNVMQSTLSTPFTESSSANVLHTYAAALLGLALAYANTAREDLIPFLVKGITEGSIELAGVAAVASGLIFCGVRSEALIKPLVERMSHINESTETQFGYLMMGFGFSMMFSGLQKPLEECEELKDLPEFPSRYSLYFQACMLGCLYLGSQDILVVHQLLEMITKEEDRLTQIMKEKKAEEERKQQAEGSSSPSSSSSSSQANSLMGMLGGLGGLGGLGTLGSAHSSPKPEEEAAKSKEDDEFQLKMMVLAIALVASGEQVNNAMVTRTLELLLVYSSKSVTEMVLLAFSLLHVSCPAISIVDQMMRKTAGGGQTNQSNSSGYRSCVNAVLALGITASGSCNSKINTHLKQVVDAEKLYNSFSSSLYVHEKAFYIHFAQGLVNLGKGLICMSPTTTDGQLFNPVSLLFIMTSLLPRLSNTTRVEDSVPMMLLMMMLGACRPRCLMLLDNKHENATLKANVRVGQAVDTTGQAGSIRNISGFQTLEAPVLLAPGERAVMVNGDHYKMATHFLDGFVFTEEK